MFFRSRTTVAVIDVAPRAERSLLARIVLLPLHCSLYLSGVYLLSRISQPIHLSLSLGVRKEVGQLDSYPLY
ncbi:unnamed protein product [Arctogadus glacialis]